MSCGYRSRLSAHETANGRAGSPLCAPRKRNLSKVCAFPGFKFGHGFTIDARETPSADFSPIAHARKLINFAKKVLAESDPTILLGGWYKPEPPAESQ